MLVGLILAAGQGSRFGSDKRQALLPSGQSLLGHAITEYAAACDKLFVVTGDHDGFAQQLCAQHGAHQVINPHARQGMGLSLACGIQAMLNAPDAELIEGVIVGLADMPGVARPIIKDVGQALRHLQQQGHTAQAVVPSYQGQLGHPRGIPRSLFGALSQLTGDQGAKAVINWTQATHWPVDDAGVLMDIDTPQDLAQFKEPERSPPAAVHPCP